MNNKIGLFFKYLFAIFIISFLINLFYEVSHSVLYDWTIPPLENTVYFYAPRILTATLGDGIFISIIFLLNCLFRKNISWVKKPEKRDYISFVLLGIASAAAVELKAMAFNSWTYLYSMPLVFGIGLTPLIQLALTGIISLFLARKIILPNL